MAMALTGGSLPDKKNFALAANYGTFQSQNAVGLSSFLRLSDNVVLSGGMAYGVDQKDFGGRAGMTFSW
jgi:hypothetical protein